MNEKTLTCCSTFFHPDYTVGVGIVALQRTALLPLHTTLYTGSRAYCHLTDYRRSGIGIGLVDRFPNFACLTLPRRFILFDCNSKYNRFTRSVK